MDVAMAMLFPDDIKDFSTARKVMIHAILSS